MALREDLALKPREAYVVRGSEGASKDVFGVAKVVRRYGDGEEVRLVPGEMLVVDFGQNCSAVPSFEVEGGAGTELEIRTSEMLNESHGEKSRGNDGPAETSATLSVPGGETRVYGPGAYSVKAAPCGTECGPRSGVNLSPAAGLRRGMPLRCARWRPS